MVKWHRKYSISIIWIFLKISQYVLQKSEIKKTFSKKTDVIAKFLGSCSFLLYIIFCHKTHFIGKYSHSDLCHNGRKMKAKSHYAINKCPTVKYLWKPLLLPRQHPKLGYLSKQQSWSPSETPVRCKAVQQPLFRE